MTNMWKRTETELKTVVSASVTYLATDFGGWVGVDGGQGSAGMEYHSGSKSEPLGTKGLGLKSQLLSQTSCTILGKLLSLSEPLTLNTERNRKKAARWLYIRTQIPGAGKCLRDSCFFMSAGHRPYSLSRDIHSATRIASILHV